MFLIVDDQKDTGAMLVRLLRHAGYEAVSVTGGVDALAMIRLRKPRLLVLDINMPDLDGLTVLRLIKEDPHLRDVRVVMYSADTRDETKVQAMRLGAVDYLVKAAVDFETLVARLVELSGEVPTVPVTARAR